MDNPFLIGPTVYLRPVERDDAALVQTWFNDPEVNRYLRTVRPMSLHAEQAFLERGAQNEHDVFLMIVRRDVEVSIGVMGLHNVHFRDRRGELGITIGDKNAWGQGFGTEATALVLQHAFATMNLHRVVLFVFEYNERAAHIYRKLGFQEEGRLRQDNYRDGRYSDTIVMGLLRTEWEQHASPTRPTSPR